MIDLPTRDEVQLRTLTLDELGAVDKFLLLHEPVGANKANFRSLLSAALDEHAAKCTKELVKALSFAVKHIRWWKIVYSEQRDMEQNRCVYCGNEAGEMYQIVHKNDCPIKSMYEALRIAEGK